MRNFLIIFSLFFMAMPLSGTAQAKSDCLYAEQSAQMRTCLSGVYEREADSLNQSYIQMQKADYVDHADLQKTQENWIAYRDAQCDLEIQNIKNESLKHIQELSCLIDLTRTRGAYLDKLSGNSGRSVHERLENIPRWMNVIGRDFPQTFWRYSDAIEGDLNCDGVADDIVLGMSVTEEGAAMILAVAQSAETGRPKTSAISLPMHRDDDGRALCSPSVRMVFNPGMSVPPAAKPQGDEKPADSANSYCSANVTLLDAICKQQTVGWHDGDFVILTQSNDDQEADEDDGQ